METKEIQEIRRIFAKDRGITLIALVVTIIVTVIIAGISVAALTGDNGIIARATESKRQKERLKEIEQEQLDNISGSMTNFVESFNEGKGCNEPKLTTGMTPVNYNWNSNKWEKCTKDNWDWNYEPQTTTTENGSGEGVAKWANAMTQDGSLWVWIPRYAYKITSGYHNKNNVGTGTIEIVFLVGTTNKDKDGLTYSTTYDIDTATTNGYMSDFVVHPVFGSNFNQGGWSEDITGFWCAKFEAGYAGIPGKIDSAKDSNVKYTSNVQYNFTTQKDNIYGEIIPNYTIMKYPIFSPGAFSYVSGSVGDFWRLAYSLNDIENPYGFSKNCNTHMMKNSEWGAVAYLTHSRYGRNSTELSINNWGPNKNDENLSSGVIYVTSINYTYFFIHTGFSSGDMSGHDSTGRNTGNLNTTYYYNTLKGTLASTTGNIYGIYDLCGGANEYVSNYAEGLNYNENSTYKSNAEYYEKYGSYMLENQDKKVTNKLSINNLSSNNSISNYLQHKNVFGDALFETSSNENGGARNTWNSDYAAYPSDYNAFLYRGGAVTDGSAAGIFYLCKGTGHVDNYIGFRVCVTTPN